MILLLPESGNHTLEPKYSSLCLHCFPYGNHCPLYMKYFSAWPAWLLLLFLYVTGAGCANMLPPGGGPRDSIAPLLLTASPENGTAPFTEKRILLSFDEYITLDKLFENLIVNPRVKTSPLITSKLRTITIRIKDSLAPNTTYTLDFGNAIKDVNEGNPLGNFLYAFSTGPVLDSHTLAGRAVLAENGEADTTLVAILHTNTSDSAILKLSPDYVSRIDGEGRFQFSFLPARPFRLFVVPNDYNKRYDDSTKFFAFHPGVLHASTNPEGLDLLVYQEYLPRQNRTAAAAPRNVRLRPLAYTTSVKNGVTDVLDTFTISFSRPLRQLNSRYAQLTDTFYRPLPGLVFDTDSAQQKLFLRGTLRTGAEYRVLLDTLVATDTLGIRIPRSDTLKLLTRQDSDYGSLLLRFIRQDTLFQHPLLLLYSGEIPVFRTDAGVPSYRQTLFPPGEYEIRILDDRNRNGRYDAGSYRQSRQPERVITLPRKLQIRANYDNEAEIRF